MRVLLLCRYGPQGASSRMRFYQFLPYLEAHGVACEISPLLVDNALVGKYRSGSYGIKGLLVAYERRIAALMRRRAFDLVWIEKEALPWMPAWIEALLLRGVPYVLDFDDAIFHNYDRHRSGWVRAIFGKRIDRLMARARLVIAGNRYLERRALEAHARWAEVLPTVVDVDRYDPKPAGAAPAATLRIVWIGSPSTAKYLALLAEPLAALAREIPFVLRVIGGGEVRMPGVEVESLPWSRDSEATMIAECDVGIMPLQDSPWEQGKCAYKLIQYMAAGLPTVASPIGANREVVEDGATGFLPESEQGWVEKLRLLLQDETLRKRMGKAGRMRVEEVYSLQRVGPRLTQLLKAAGGQ